MTPTEDQRDGRTLGNSRGTMHYKPIWWHLGLGSGDKPCRVNWPRWSGENTLALWSFPGPGSCWLHTGWHLGDSKPWHTPGHLPESPQCSLCHFPRVPVPGTGPGSVFQLHMGAPEVLSVHPSPPSICKRCGQLRRRAGSLLEGVRDTINLSPN